MKFLPDEPITAEGQDALGFCPFVDLMAEAVANTACPFVYGVVGDWGTGKTSVLRMLQSRLENAYRVAAVGDAVQIPIWFDAWFYENDSNAVYPLLNSIRQDYVQRLEEEASNGLREKFLRVAKASVLGLGDLVLRAATHQLTGEAYKMEDAEHALKLAIDDQTTTAAVEMLGKWANEVGRLQSAFKELLAAYASAVAEQKKLKPEDVRFVIVVDDLDRCLPDTAVRILECIKNFLAAPNCIFMLGVNPRVVYEGIKTKFPGVDVDGREYLEKIINYSFYVPEPDVDQAVLFAKARLEELVGDEERRALGPQIDVFTKVLKKCNFNNPRKIKRILNRYLMFLNRYKRQIGNYDLENIVRFIVMSEYFPPLFSLYTNQNDSWQDLRKVGSGGFELVKFEQTHGLSLRLAFRQILAMKELFTVEPNSALAPIQEQAQAVYAIARSL